MHLSSLLCYSSAFIHSSSCPVCGKWACGHTLLSALGVPHCCSSSVVCRAPVSPSLFLHQTLFMFSNCAGEEGDGRCGWRSFVSAGAVAVGAAREKWHFTLWESVYAVRSHSFTPHCSWLAHIVLFFFFRVQTNDTYPSMVDFMMSSYLFLVYFFQCCSLMSSTSRFSMKCTVKPVV